MHSPFGFMHLTHQSLSARALFCLNSLAKVNTHLLIYKYAEAIDTVCAAAILELKQALGVQTTLNLTQAHVCKRNHPLSLASIPNWQSMISVYYSYTAIRLFH